MKIKNKSNSVIDSHTYEEILSWLNPDRESTEEKFDEIFEKLKKFFEWNTLWDPNECAYRTILIVWQENKERNMLLVENPELLFLDSARNLEKVIDSEIFQSILKLLDRDEKQAAIIYSEIYQDLIDYFIKRKIDSPEECVDKTFIRISTKLDSKGMIGSKSGDLDRVSKNYIFWVARNIAYEYWRARRDRLVRIISDIKDIDQQLHDMLVMEDPDEDIEKDCQKKCLTTLKTENLKTWKTLSGYLTGSKPSREIQAEELGISRNALSSRIKRIKEGLKQCAEKCVDKLLHMSNEQY